MLFCPKCGERTGVYDTRISFEGKTRRKRLCPKCSHRYSTIEILDTKRVLKVRQPKAPAPKKDKPTRVPKKSAPKRQEHEVRRFDQEEVDYADSFANDFADVVRELGIGGLNDYD